MATITDAGLAVVAKRLNGSGADAAFTYIATGSGSTAESTSHTALVAENTANGSARATATCTQENTGDSKWVKTFTFTGNDIMSHGKQVSPDKNVNFRCTTASFTVSPAPWALTCCAVLPGDSALYDISVRRPTSLPPASFRPHLTVTPLPLASNSC